MKVFGIPPFSDDEHSNKLNNLELDWWLEDRRRSSGCTNVGFEYKLVSLSGAIS